MIRMGVNERAKLTMTIREKQLASPQDLIPIQITSINYYIKCLLHSFKLP